MNASPDPTERLCSPEFSGKALLAAFDALPKRIQTVAKTLVSAGDVRGLTAIRRDQNYSATVQTTPTFHVLLEFNDKTPWWRSRCSCSKGTSCAHAGAAMLTLLEHWIRSTSQDGSQAATATQTRPNQRKPALPAPPKVPPGFPSDVAAKTSRPLTQEEINFARSVQRLWERASYSGLVFSNDLRDAGFPAPNGFMVRVVLWTSKQAPESILEFLPYVALYLTKHQYPIPEAFAALVDLDLIERRIAAAEQAEKLRAWEHHFESARTAVRTHSPDIVVNLRLRFAEKEAIAEFQLGQTPWVPFTSAKIDQIDDKHAHDFRGGAALLWAEIREASYLGNAGRFDYVEPDDLESLGRILQQPLVRELIVDDAGEPIEFLDGQARWDLREPAPGTEAYQLQLLRPDGTPFQKVQAIIEGTTAYYLTPDGFIAGPGGASPKWDLAQPVPVPAAALETNAGIAFLDAIRVPLPDRIAAKVTIIKYRPRITGKLERAGYSNTDWCHLQVDAITPQGTSAEALDRSGWHPVRSKPPGKAGSGILQIDRSSLVATSNAIHAAGFKSDPYNGTFAIRATRKFPALFLQFLESLPADTVFCFNPELDSIRNASVAGRVRLDAEEDGIDWFNLRVLVDVQETTLSPDEITLLLNARGDWVRLKDKGWRRLAFELSDEEDQALARLGLTARELTSEPQRLHALQLADPAARRFLPAQSCDRIDLRAREIQTRVAPPVPAAISATLRPYQTEGFHFLAYLATNRFGGILADDMGLGKTLQTLTWLEWLRNATSPAATQPSLVVCPKSVADNWRQEAARFSSQLRVRVWTAGELPAFGTLAASADLHVLNYTQLRLAADHLARTEFLALILDEGQYIKNPSSQIAQIARSLRAQHRLVLSGTPIENRLLDLWSLMSFAMPGALGSRAEFTRIYDSKKDPLARQRLAARVRPFLLRRTKSQVATDLPDRIEEDLACDLEDRQKALYQAELKRAQQMLLKVQSNDELHSLRFHFLTSLLRMRQICCDPRLVNPAHDTPGAKLEALLETLEPIVDQGHKVLVFSQFVEMLALIKPALEARQWKSWRLAGDTEDRGPLVDSFQKHDGPGVFLISLKAGGFGLNLTAASYVVLFDPWWNPAVENQAIDRTHRIGQTQKVVAYRLIMKGTIEEKIRELQSQKKALAHDILGEEKFAQSLTLQDFQFLFGKP